MTLLSHTKTKDRKYKIQAAVRDCITYNLSEKEALAYIKKVTGGEELNVRSYYRIKAYMEKDPSIQLWLNSQSKIGFVIAHKAHIQEIDKSRAEMWRMLLHEQEKPEELQDKHLIAKLYSQIEDNIKVASALNLGTPILSNIKNLIDKAESKDNDTKDKANNYNYNNHEQFNRNTLFVSKHTTEPRRLPEGPTKDPALY